MAEFKIGNRLVGSNQNPLVIAEVGINHEGSFAKAKKMVDDACAVGCECVKFQCHVIDDEMIPWAKDVIPGNAKISIWEIMNRCQLSEDDDLELKRYVEGKGMLYMSTPFSRAAAERLQRMNVEVFKIGSGECNNYPLVEHIAGYGKPVILSTGMNDISSIAVSVKILRKYNIPFALLHCTSTYPTAYRNVRLMAIKQIIKAFPDAVVGLSDHSIGNYTCFGAVSLGASIIEKHFTSDKRWAGPDIPISVSPAELADLIKGCRAVHEATDGKKEILAEEKITSDFAYASVVSIQPISKGEVLSLENIWVKRPGTGEFLASDFATLCGRTAQCDIPPDVQITKYMIEV